MLNASPGCVGEKDGWHCIARVLSNHLVHSTQTEHFHVPVHQTRLPVSAEKVATLTDYPEQKPDWRELVKLQMQEVTAFRTSSYIFVRNYEEALDYLATLQGDADGVSILNRDNVERQMETGREIARLLHNCVTAAVSLRNSVNAMHKRLHGRERTFPEFSKERTARFENDPTIQFVVKLRDYMVHSKPPNLGLR
jgi:hypothetical protein